MKERRLKGLWVAGTAVVSSTAFVVFGIMLGGSRLGWDIHVVSASAVLAVLLATGSAALWVVWKKKQDVKAGYPAKDERTRLLEGRAAYYTVLVLGYLMLALLWYSFLGVDLLNLPALNATQVLIACILADAALFAGFRWYFLRKGETA